MTLEEKYKKLLGFVKLCAENEKYLDSVAKDWNTDMHGEDITMRASDLLKEIGELE